MCPNLKPMKTLYIFLLSCFSAFVIHAQNLSIDSISLHTQEATLCDADTIYIYFRTSVNFTPVGGARVMVNFPSNYSPQGNGLLNLFPVAGPFFPIAPNFLSGNSYTYPFGTLGPNESYVMKVPFVAS